MPKHYCDYCDVFLTHDSASVRKAHNSGRNHLANVRDYYASLGHDKAQNIIDQITSAYESGSGPPPGGFGFGPQHLGPPGPGFGGPGGPPPFGGFGGPRPPFPPGPGFMPPPGMNGPPPFPPNMGPPGGFPGGAPPFPPMNGGPPFPPMNANFTGPPIPGQGPPNPNAHLSDANPNGPPGQGGPPGAIHPDRMRMMNHPITVEDATNLTMPRPLRLTPCSGSRNSYQLVGHRRTAGGRFNALSRRLGGGSTRGEVKFGGWQRRAAGNFASSISHLYERNVEYNGMLPRRLGSRVGSMYSAYIPRSTWRIGLGKNGGCKCYLKSPRYPRELEPQFLISAPFLLAPLLALLKSSTILKSVAALSRISFTLIAPLRLGGRRFLRWWHGPDYDILHPPPHLHDFSNGSRPIKPKHFRRTTLVLVYGPLLLLVIGLLASLERTPVWGRWRVIMLSDAEEVEAMREILAIEIQQDDGSASKALPASNGPIKRKRNWLPILRVILGEESNSGVQSSDDRTLLGFRVLDDDDWRVKWVQDVLNRLETGIIECNIFSDPSGNVASEGHRKKYDSGDDANRDSTAESLDKAGTNYRIPPVKIPIELRSALLEYLGVDRDSVSLDSLLNNYGLVVVDNPQSEAFCFGFGPGLKSGPNMEGNAENQLQMHDEALGVVVVYTGLLNEIIAMDSAGSVERPTASSPTNSLPFPLNAFVKSAPPHEVLPPTETQAARLAVVLSHELSHLLLSHSLESLTATDFYFLLGNLSTDLLRTLLYPLTALLGPIVNDWLGEQIRIPTGLGLNIRSSCESRKAETEADLLGLRILQGAGYDPKVALSVWGPNGLFERIRKKQREEETEGEKVKASDRKGEDLSVEKGNGGATGGDEDMGADSESEDWGTWLEKNGWLHSHPPDEVRYRRIKEELASWAV